MTPTDLLFLYFCACALSWGAHWMRVWERADRRRQWKDPVNHLTCGFSISREAIIIADNRRIVVDVDWIPSKFCANEYKINEIVNKAFIDTIFGIGPIKVSTRQIELKRENRKA